jgi:hypothetical protein
LLGEERKEKSKKQEKQLGAFFPGPEPDTPCWLYLVGFLQLLGAI